MCTRLMFALQVGLPQGFLRNDPTETMGNEEKRTPIGPIQLARIAEAVQKFPSKVVDGIVVPRWPELVMHCCIVSKCQNPSLLNSLGKQVSRPICFLQNAAAPLSALSERIEFSKLRRTFGEFGTIGMIRGIGICPLVCPRPFGMAIESVDKDNATLYVSSF